MNEPARDSHQIDSAQLMPAPAEAVPLVDDVAPAQSKAVGRVEIVISTMLRAGVITSVAIIYIGMAVSFVRHPSYANDPQRLTQLTSQDAPFPHSLRDVFSGVMSFRGQAIMALGLLILIATPVLRVAISIVGFVVQKDRVFVAITCTVLALLMLSFLLGHAGA